MDESPRRVKHGSSARRLLFAANKEEKSMRRYSSGDGHARRKLVLDEVTNSRRETNVVARLMGLESLPRATRDSQKPEPVASSAMATENTSRQAPLHELLRIKEPLLLRELLRETEEEDDHVPGADHRHHHQKGSSLVEKFVAGLVRRTRAPAEDQKSTKVSPIKSPSTSKRGSMAEAAVRISEDGSATIDKSKEVRTKKKKKFSLHRSSSEPILKSSSSSSSSSSSGKLARISESFGRELRQRFGPSDRSSTSSSSCSSSSASSSRLSRKNSKSGTNLLVRSKSDLGLESRSKWSGSRRERDREPRVETIRQKLEELEQEEDHLVSFSRTGKLVTMKSSIGSSDRRSSSGILSLATHRLFGNHREQEMRTGTMSDGDGGLARKDRGSTATSDTGRKESSSSSSSSLMRALLRRSRFTSKSGPASIESKALSFQVTTARSTSSSSSSRQSSARDSASSSSGQGLADDSSSSSSSCVETTSSESLEFCDALLDDRHARSEGSGSSPTSSSCEACECNRSSRSEGGQPSPVSVLEPPFVDEIHTSPLDGSSDDDSPGSKLRSSSGTGHAILNAILDISRVRCIDLSSIGITDAASGTNSLEEEAAYIDDVLATSQRFLCDRNEELSSVAATRRWLCRDDPVASQVFGVLETTMSSRTHARGSLQCRKLLFDCIAEAVELRFGCLRRQHLGAGSLRLIGVGIKQVGAEVQQQISDWQCMVSLSTDELVEKDMSVGVGKWAEWNEQVELIARDVECNILRTLIDEVVCEWSGQLLNR